MTTVIAVAIVILIIGGAAFYVYRSHKQGNACVGCPYGGKCSGCCSKTETK